MHSATNRKENYENSLTHRVIPNERHGQLCDPFSALWRRIRCKFSREADQALPVRRELVLVASRCTLSSASGSMTTASTSARPVPILHDDETLEEVHASLRRNRVGQVGPQLFAPFPDSDHEL